MAFAALVGGLITLVHLGMVGPGSGTFLFGFWMPCIIPAFFRCKNIGMNPWWGLLMIVPLANLFIMFRCLVFQENHRAEGKLDRSGRWLAGVVILATLCFSLALASEGLAR